MNKVRYTVMICLLLPFIAKGDVIDVAPGELARELESQITIGADVVLRGSIDARDFPSLSDLSRRVTSLDMSGLKIKETRLQISDGYGKTYYEEWELPPYLFFQSTVKRVDLPNGLLALPEGLFAASGVEKIVIPSTVAAVGDYAFYDASDLQDVEGTEMLKTIGSNAFDKTRIRFLDVSSVTKYSAYALAGMNDLREVKINPEASYGPGVLMGCGKLYQIEGMPEHVPELMAALSSDLSPGRYVGDAERFGAYAFASAGTVWLSLGENVESLEDGVFANSTSLVSIDAKSLGDRTPSVTEKTFEGVDVSHVELYVAEDSADVWRSHPVWGLFDIRTGQNSVEEIESESGPAIKIKENIITVEGNGWKGEVDIFGLSGEHLYNGRCDDVLEINASRWSGQMLIVKAGARSKVILNSN